MPLVLGFALALAAALSSSAAHAQEADWRPPAREMPGMPSEAELRADWRSGRADWFRGVDAVSGVPITSLRAAGEPRRGSSQVQLARFSSGPLPVVVWTDRNGDGRCDMIEIYRRGGVVVQLVDADYDGSANALRIYDADGVLVRQQRM